MKPYRQTNNINLHRQKIGSTKKPQPQLNEPFSFKLKTLVDQHSQKHVTLNCNLNINVIMQQRTSKKKEFSAILNRGQENAQRIKIYSEEKSSNKLRQCFETFHHNSHQYVFISNQIQSLGEINCGKKINFTMKRTSQKNTQRHSSNFSSNQNMIRLEQYQQDRRNLNYFSDPKEVSFDENIFIVQEEDDLQFVEDKEDTRQKQPINQLSKKINCQRHNMQQLIVCNNISSNNLPKQSKLSAVLKQNINEINNCQKPQKSYFKHNQFIKDFSQKQNPKYAVANLSRRSVQESCKTLIESFRPSSGKIYLDGANEMVKQQLIENIQQFSDISSIMGTKEEKKQIELDSIKQEIDKIESFITVDKQPKAVLPTQNKQIENNEFVQITQKILQPNRSEYYVRYNFRFLDKKSKTNEVVRISPLKFRKKEEIITIPLNSKLIQQEHRPTIV